MAQEDKIIRREHLSLRVTPVERDEIREIADSYDQDVSTFLRESALNRKKEMVHE